MEDSGIIELFFDRDEKAITYSIEKYGTYCYTIANNILGNKEDSEECINETWFAAWNAIPPERPRCLRAYFARITRNIATNIYRKNTSKKRGGGEIGIVFDELSECAADDIIIEDEIEKRELVHYINSFLDALPERERAMFVRRYFFAESIRDIALRFKVRENYIRAMISKTRRKLKKYLEEVYFK